MQERLVKLWECAMRNPALDTDARLHIERVLNQEFLAQVNALRLARLGRVQRLAAEPSVHVAERRAS